MIDRLGRRRTNELVVNGLTAGLSEILEVPTDPIEQKELLAEVKARRYALFANLIDRQIVMAEELRLSQPSGGFPPSPYRHRANEPFGRLRLDALKVFIESAQALQNCDEYRQLDELAEIRSKLGGEYGYVYPLGQLSAGSDTAISTMLNLLKNMPRIIKYHESRQKKCTKKVLEIARESTGLPWNIAMISINQMMALQTASAGRLIHENWSEFDFDIDPTIFKLDYVSDGRAQSVKFNKLDRILIPAGYRFMEDHPPLPKPTLLQDIPSVGPGVVGCPITFLPEGIEKLWRWFIDDVEREGLWP